MIMLDYILFISFYISLIIFYILASLAIMIFIQGFVYRLTKFSIYRWLMRNLTSK